MPQSAGFDELYLAAFEGVCAIQARATQDFAEGRNSVAGRVVHVPVGTFIVESQEASRKLDMDVPSPQLVNGVERKPFISRRRRL